MAIENPDVRPGLDARGALLCSCGGRQLTVAYSAHYQGLVFTCTKHGLHVVCRSQDEGEYPTLDSAYRSLGFYAVRYGLGIDRAMSNSVCDCGDCKP
jgi:hypothetical protein